MKKSNRIFFLCGIVMLISECWKQYSLTFLVNHGDYDWWYFPFQLCSIPMYLCLSLPFLRSQRAQNAVRAFLMTFGMIGGIFVFFDTSGMHYPYLPLTVHSYLWHIGLILLGAAAGLLFREPLWSAWRDSVRIYLVCCALATLLNVLHHGRNTVNFFYINFYYGMHQRVFGRIAESLGNTPAILVYMGATVAGTAIFFFLWRRFRAAVRP